MRGAANLCWGLAALLPGGARSHARTRAPHALQLLSQSQSQCRPQSLSTSTSSSSSSSSATIMPPPGGAATNSLLLQDDLPRFDVFEPSHVEPGLDALLSELEAKQRDLEHRLEAQLSAREVPTYEGVVEAVERLEAPVSFAWGMVSHLVSVRTSDELRAAHQASQPRIVEAMQRMSQSKVVYSALKAVANAGPLSPTQQRIVDKSVQAMEMAGIGLEGEDQTAFNALKQEQARLGTEFANHVLDSTKAFSLEITEKKDVAGLPDSALALLAQNHATAAAASASAAEGETAAAEGETAAAGPGKPDKLEGPWLLTLDAPSYSAFIKHADSSALREKLYRAQVTRASEGELDNAPLIRRILEIRKQTAAMLGFPSFAHQSIASKMVESPEHVLRLLDSLRARSATAATAERARLEAMAMGNASMGNANASASDANASDANASGAPQVALRHWDVAYWADKLRERDFAFSEEDLRPYFALDEVLDGLFAVLRRTFSLRAERADGAAPVWHPDVRFFRLFDERDGGRHVASFYVDPCARAADKRSGAWMDSAVGRSRALGRERPAAYLVLNASPPVAAEGKPALLSFGDVETLFHEMGHALQHMATQVTEGDAAGINLVEWDAVEVPSHFMENFCYDRKAMAFARHWKTGEPLPADLWDKVVQARTFMAATSMMRQLSFAALDMELHGPEVPDDPIALQMAVLERYMPEAKPLPEDRFLCSFQHLFAGGYAAGYYSYKHSEVMAADAYAAFEEAAATGDDAELDAVGAKFRDTVLALGGSEHPADVFRRFRGRDPTPDALLRHAGLDAQTPPRPHSHL